MLGGQWIFALTATRRKMYTWWPLFGVFCLWCCRLFLLSSSLSFFLSLSLSWVLITLIHKYVVIIFVYTNNLTRTKHKTIKMNYPPVQCFECWGRNQGDVLFTILCRFDAYMQSISLKEMIFKAWIYLFSSLFIHIRIKLWAFECHNTHFVCMFELVN